LTKLYLDSSAIVKRYVEETGSESASLIYNKSDVQELTLCFSIWNVGEVIGVIDIYQKRRWITEDQSNKARVNLASETLRLLKFEALELLNLSSAVLTESWGLIRKYRMYQADALQIVQCKRAGADLLVSADKALLQLAEREGLTSMNIEDVSEVKKQMT
jgi:predicted nucleic acid-binding protein